MAIGQHASDLGLNQQSDSKPGLFGGRFSALTIVFIELVVHFLLQWLPMLATMQSLSPLHFKNVQEKVRIVVSREQIA